MHGAGLEAAGATRPGCLIIALFVELLLAAAAAALLILLLEIKTNSSYACIHVLAVVFFFFVFTGYLHSSCLNVR